MRVGPPGNLFVATPLQRESKDFAVLFPLGAPASPMLDDEKAPPQKLQASIRFGARMIIVEHVPVLRPAIETLVWMVNWLGISP